jgi:hypothetical protein
LQSGDLGTLDRLHSLAAGLATRSDGSAIASGRAVSILAQSVKTQANLQACIDGLAAIAVSSIIAFVLLLAFEPPPQGPASPRRPFGRLSWRSS